ncbi:hypothetical protein FOPG_06073 [Fusarium oxysporum f. sp. conglutinans race 2 54008]|uniref:Uncharacterized protein n=1 Tax=Fusarium oxysporum f. sp. conglutinans race 2 54008 TaxID=1089457 RepID=X0HVE6_FUSOX|nr:hypothetical protein FOPG_06073 [Fusarium oxysporum f. sp. conglutinans race 2 54008]
MTVECQSSGFMLKGDFRQGRVIPQMEIPETRVQVDIPTAGDEKP